MHTLRLSGQTFPSPAAVVDGLLAVQSENHAQASWAVATRTPGITEAHFGQLSDDGAILRRTIGPSEAVFELGLFRDLDDGEVDALQAAADHCGTYLGLDPRSSRHRAPTAGEVVPPRLSTSLQGMVTSGQNRGGGPGGDAVGVFLAGVITCGWVIVGIPQVAELAARAAQRRRGQQPRPNPERGATFFAAFVVSVAAMPLLLLGWQGLSLSVIALGLTSFAPVAMKMMDENRGWWVGRTARGLLMLLVVVVASPLASTCSGRPRAARGNS